jgi:hypothetical protein
MHAAPSEPEDGYLRCFFWALHTTECLYFTGTHVRHGPGLTWNVVGLENALVTKEREWALNSQRAALGVVVDDSQHLGVLAVHRRWK